MKRLFSLTLLFGLGLLTGLYLHDRPRTLESANASVTPAVPGAPETALEHARRHLNPKFVCPMHPNVVQDHPGSCPICGMALVERVEEAPRRTATVVLVPAVIDQLGVRTQRVQLGTIPRPIQAPGYAVLGAAGRAVPVGPTRTAPAGSGVAPQPITVWAQIYERQALWVKVGQRAEVRFPSLGAERWSGEVEYADQTINRTTGTLEVRIRLDATPAEIRPNLYAQVTIDADPLQDVLVMPRDALIATERESRVILALGDGRFEPRTVKVQSTDGDRVAVLDGLQAGDEVVVSAQFLLDSEANLQAGLSRLTDAGAERRQVAERSLP